MTQSLRCDFEADVDPCHQGFAPDVDPAIGPGSGPPNPFVIILRDTPQSVRVTVSSPNGVEHRTLEPEYQRFEPNGPGCGGCLSVDTTLQFSH